VQKIDFVLKRRGKEAKKEGGKHFVFERGSETNGTRTALSAAVLPATRGGKHKKTNLRSLDKHAGRQHKEKGEKEVSLHSPRRPRKGLKKREKREINYDARASSKGVEENP